jgi:cytochrome c biogenesis protein
MWRSLTSMRTALVLLFLLALAAIPGSLVPQERVDPSAVFNFRDRHPDLTPWFERLGMFNVYSSVWFSAVYLLLMVSLIGCIVPRVRVYWRQLRQPPTDAPRVLARMSAYETWTTDRPAPNILEEAEQLFRRRRHRVVRYPGEATTVAAQKGHLAEAGNLIFHVAFVVVLVGVAVTALFGFKGTAIVVVGEGFSNTLTQYDEFTPGARFTAGDLTPFSVDVDDFHVRWEDTGAGSGTPTEFAAALTVQEALNDPERRYNLRVNHPLKVGGTSVFLVGHGYAPGVTVRDGTGEIAYSGPVVFLPQDGSFVSFGVVKVPDARPTQLGFEGYFFPTAALTEDGRPYSAFPDAQNPVLSLVGYHGDLGLDDGQPQSVYSLDKDDLEVFNVNGEPSPLLLREGQRITLPDGGGSISFDGYQRWVRLQVSESPGKLVPLAGVLLAIAGLLLSLFVRPRRTWVRVRAVDRRTVVEVATLDRTSGGDPAAFLREVGSALRTRESQPTQEVSR